MNYLSIADCKTHVFRFIHEAMSHDEPALDYEYERNGMAQLETLLFFMSQDKLYPTLEEKAAYLMCSIAGSQHFSNGNKRLSVMLLLAFLGLNNVGIVDFNKNELQAVLKIYFPKHVWQSSTVIDEPHALFLYNIAIAIGDPHVWNVQNFEQLKILISKIFKILYKIG